MLSSGGRVVCGKFLKVEKADGISGLVGGEGLLSHTYVLWIGTTISLTIEPG